MEPLQVPDISDEGDWQLEAVASDLLLPLSRLTALEDLQFRSSGYGFVQGMQSGFPSLVSALPGLTRLTRLVMARAGGGAPVCMIDPEALENLPRLPRLVSLDVLGVSTSGGGEVRLSSG